MLTTAFGLARGGVATAWRRNENGDQTDKSLQEVLTQQALCVGDPARLFAMNGHLNLNSIGKLRSRDEIRYTWRGQAMPYQEKFSELVAHEGDLNPTKEKYPMMAAEIGITAASLSGVASTIRAAYDLRKKLEVKLRLRPHCEIDKAAGEREA